MYTLLIVLALTSYGNGVKTLTSTSIEFANKSLCESAKSDIESEVGYYDKKTVVCLKTK